MVAVVGAFIVCAVACWFAVRSYGRCRHRWNAVGITVSGALIDVCEHCEVCRIIAKSGHAVFYTKEEFARMNMIRRRLPRGGDE